VAQRIFRLNVHSLSQCCFHESCTPLKAAGEDPDAVDASTAAASGNGDDSDGEGTMRVFRPKSTLEDAIGLHTCSLDPSMRVTNSIHLGVFTPLTGWHCKSNCVQTLKVVAAVDFNSLLALAGAAAAPTRPMSMARAISAVVVVVVVAAMALAETTQKKQRRRSSGWSNLDCHLQQNWKEELGKAFGF
jgi:hypothetical protein